MGLSVLIITLIDPATGAKLEPTTGWSVPVLQGQPFIQIPDTATREIFGAAMDQARGAYPQLAGRDINLGIFRDDDNHTIDIIPVLYTTDRHTVDAVGSYEATMEAGAYGHSTWAYDHATGNLYWTPHVEDPT